jgi:hypothetical protein
MFVRFNFSFSQKHTAPIEHSVFYSYYLLSRETLVGSFEVLAVCFLEKIGEREGKDMPGISSYRVECLNDGSWHELAKLGAAKIAQAHQFADVEPVKVRVTAGGVAGNPPTLTEFGIYNEPRL